MKREIKFKAWNKEANRFSKPFTLKSDVLNYTDDDGLGIVKSLTNEIILQYTGLKDKNGKEIYEGDILERVDTKQTFLVIWNKDCYLVRMIYDSWLNKNVLNHKKDGSLNFMTTFEIEIIGNIYENPELIET